MTVAGSGMISEPNNTIFVFGPKTGGQSIEQAFLDAHDLAWDGRVPLLMRATADRAAGPARLVHLTAREYVACGHVTAGTLAVIYAFAVVRHPHVPFMSELRYRQTGHPTTSA